MNNQNKVCNVECCKYKCEYFCSYYGNCPYELKPTVMTIEEFNKYVNMGDIKKDEEITTERAIAEICRLAIITEHESYEYKNLTQKAVNMAISALKREQSDEELDALTDFLNDIEEVMEKHGFRKFGHGHLGKGDTE